MNARRVRHLRLTCPDRGSAKRGVYLIEDALRTASLPEAQAGRVLVIRKLALGRIHTRDSPSRVALELERRVRALASTAVYFADASAGDPAIWFRDEIEPFVELAVRIARHQPLRAWFWPLVVRNWRPALSTDTALKIVLRGALGTSAAPLAAAGMVRTLLQAGALEPLLSALGPADGPSLLAACGWSVGAVSGSSGPRHLGASMSPTPRPMWRPTLRRWTARWSARDARSIWLTAAALTSDRPGRARTATLPVDAWRAAIALEHAETAVPVAVETEPISELDAGDRELPVKPTPDSPSTDSNHAPDPGPVNDSEGRPTSSNDEHPRARGAEPFIEADGPGDPATPSLRQTPDAPMRSPKAGRPSSPPPGETAQEPRDSTGEREITAAPKLRLFDHPAPTTHGGLYFLLPVLARLGIAKALDAHPDWREWDLGHRALDRAATRAGAHPDDPIRPDDIEGRAPPPRCTFRAPDSWWAQLGPSGDLRVGPRVGDPSATVLVDAADMPWALWREGPPADLPPARPTPHWVGATSDLSTLADAWVGAAARWLERADETLTLDAVIRRPAAILRTRTHVDILLNLDDTDIRLRRLALDVNPGFVPWFGRVVTFHYLIGGRRDCD